MKTFGKYSFSCLAVSALVLSIIFQIAAKSEEPDVESASKSKGSDTETIESEESPSPLTGYRFVSDRVFDPLTGISAEEQSPEVEELRPVATVETVPNDATPSSLSNRSETAPHDVAVQFPAILPTEVAVQSNTSSVPAEFSEAPSPEHVETTAGESAGFSDIASASEDRPTFLLQPEKPLGTDGVIDTAAGFPAPPTADSVGTSPEGVEPSILAELGDREVSADRDESILFPLTLEIPGFDPSAIPSATLKEPVPAETTVQTANMDRQNEVPASNPLLKHSSPAVVGVGATLADSNSDIYIDALVPFYQIGNESYRTIFFVAPRLADGEDINNGSVGLGVRSLHGQGTFLGDSFPWIMGANVFYDFTRSSRDFDYNQFGAGLEWMSPFLDLRINAYFPEDTENQIAETSSSRTSSNSSTTSTTTFEQPFATGFTVVQPFTTTETTITRRTTTTRFFEQYERALEGFDGEAGILIPDNLTLFPIRIYGGFYSFDNPFGEDISGPKARIEARPFSFLLLDASWYQDEELLGSTWFLGARARMTIGGGPASPESSKPLHDATEGPKLEAYNPYASFQSRLVERIPRNYRSVIIDSPFIEDEARRQVSVSSFSTTTSITGSNLLASRLIFVDASRGSISGAGTFENPLNSIQSGADLAIANLGASGRIWTVWTQGGVGPYNENVTVTDSVRFISNAIPIQGQGGGVFGGTFPGPVVNGGFLFGSFPASAASPIIPEGSVRGYEITGGHTAASFAGITFVNVENAVASSNRIDTIGGTGIQVINRGTISGRGTFASNGIFNAGNHGIHFDFADSAEGTYEVSDSGFENLGGNAVRIHATDSASFDVTVTRTGASGLANSGLFVSADSTASGTANLANSSIDGGGVDTAASGSSNIALKVSGTRFENDPDSVFTLAVSDSAELVSEMRNNVLESNQSALSLQVSNSAASDTHFSQNSVNNSTTNAVSIAFEATNTQTLEVSGNEISATDGTAIFINATAGSAEVIANNNTIDTATNNGFHIRSGGTASVTASLSGNGTSNTSDGGFLIRSAGTGNLSATLVNNVTSNSGTYGARLRAANNSNASIEVTGNTFAQTVAAAIELVGLNNGVLSVVANSNVISDTGIAGIFANAESGSIVNLTAENNNISSTTEEGILFTGSDNSSSRFEARGNLISSTGNASGIRGSYLDDHDAVIQIQNNQIGPVAQQGVQIETSDSTTASILLSGNTISDTSQDGIRMTLFSTEDQSAVVTSNSLARLGANAINVSTQGPKEVTIDSNFIQTTGAAAVRAEMQSAGLIFSGASLGNNVYVDATPVPFNDAGTAPFTGGDGILINTIAYP
ncbi:MAG: inverse autotransporter beta domain-containing protein [Verrucomicrobiota bacterium]